MVSFNQFDCIKLDPELFMFFIQGFLEILAWYYIYFFFKYDYSFPNMCWKSKLILFSFLLLTFLGSWWEKFLKYNDRAADEIAKKRPYIHRLHHHIRSCLPLLTHLYRCKSHLIHNPAGRYTEMSRMYSDKFHLYTDWVTPRIHSSLPLQSPQDSRRVWDLLRLLNKSWK